MKKYIKLIQVFIPFMVFLILFCVEYSSVSATTNPINLITLSDHNDLQAYIDYNGKPVTQDTLKNSDKLYQITLTDYGILLLQAYSTNDKSYVSIYSNSNLTSCLIYNKSINETGTKLSVYLDPGTYYIKVTNPTKYNDTVTNYIGFLPSTTSLNVNSITLNKAKSQATIRLNVGVDLYDEIRVVQGDILYTDIANNKIWESTSKNIVTKGVFALTKNGVYTARLLYNNGQSMTTIHFEITNLKDTKPCIPTIKTCNAGTSFISGTALKYATLYTQIGYSKYTTKVKSNGTYVVSTCSLRKGMKIKSWIVDSNGMKSNVTYHIIK